MWCSLFKTVLLIICATCYSININNVKQCIHEEIMKSNWKKKTDSPFHLHYGDATVEIFNVVSKHDIKRIKFLAACVRKDDPDFFQEYHTAMRFGDSKHFGGGNATSLTGLFPLLLPDIKDKIELALLNVYKELDWGSYYNGEQLGIRSCSEVSFVAEKAMITRKEVIDARNKYYPKDAFVVNKEQPLEPGDEADEALVKFVKRDPVSKFTVILMMTPRGRYAGGPVVAQLSLQDNEGNVDFYDKDPEDNYYEEEDLRTTEGIMSEPNPLDVWSSKYGRYQPEIGTAFFIRSDHPHTVLPVQHGHRDYLAIELWSYMSSPVPTSNHFIRPGILEAKPFPKKEEL